MPELHPLGPILEEAHKVGRCVIFTADHGHIIDRDATQVSAPGGGERWKRVDSGAADGEVLVTGARVIDESGEPGGTVILPWVEQRQYGTRRNGYHGGITPQEVFVPLAVLGIDAPTDEWAPVRFAPPS